MWAVLLYMLRHRLWSQRHCFNPLCVCFVSSDNWCESLLLNQSPVKERIHWILYNSFHIPLVINLQCPMSVVEFARNSAYVSIANKKCLYCTALHKNERVFEQFPSQLFVYAFIVIALFAWRQHHLIWCRFITFAGNGLVSWFVSLMANWFLSCYTMFHKKDLMNCVLFYISYMIVIICVVQYLLETLCNVFFNLQWKKIKNEKVFDSSRKSHWCFSLSSYCLF